MTPETLTQKSMPRDRDAQALACITDEQAFASWERFREMRTRYVEAVFEEAQ